jgi:HPt (histidine-containing phosphotransfer) domain-containing protein
MTEFDPELLKDLAEEIDAISRELSLVVGELKKNSEQPLLFEKFGQMIDRIYGTAATFGMKELASYCGTLKKICYACASAGVPRGNIRVLRLLEVYLENVSALVNGVADPEVMKKLSYTFLVEEKKAEKIQEEIFSFKKK